MTANDVAHIRESDNTTFLAGERPGFPGMAFYIHGFPELGRFDTRGEAIAAWVKYRNAERKRHAA